MTVGDRIRKKRENLGISLTDMAEMIGVSKQNLYKYEKNVITNIPSDKIEKISKILGVSESYIMGWEENLNEKSSDFVTNILSDNDLTEHIKKLKCLNDEHRRFIYDITVYWYEKEGH